MGTVKQTVISQTARGAYYEERNRVGSDRISVDQRKRILIYLTRICTAKVLSEPMKGILVISVIFSLLCASGAFFTVSSVAQGETTKGKKVSYIENVPIWHYRAPNAEEYKVAVKEVESCDS